jgi:hypothetical protein
MARIPVAQFSGSAFLFSSLAFSAMALSALVITLPSGAAPKTSNAKSSSQSDNWLRMVMVDQAKLSNEQRDGFQRYLQTANLPHTKIGKRCQYYTKPQVWCLILDPPVAERVYNQLKQEKAFNAALDMKPVRRLRVPDRN